MLVLGFSVEFVGFSVGLLTVVISSTLGSDFVFLSTDKIVSLIVDNTC
jgi:hypothetical protein